MEMEEIRAKARENILSDNTGKFDLIESIFPLPFLLSQKPRQIKGMICEKLELNPSDINYRTFISWLRRLRKKHATDNNSKEKGKEDWQSFNPSEPQPSQQISSIVLKKIVYKS